MSFRPWLQIERANFSGVVPEAFFGGGFVFVHLIMTVMPPKLYVVK